MKAEEVLITPAMAEEWLEKYNTHNRSYSIKTTESYARDMKAGMWAVNNQGIGFDEEGNLIDGQHRLAAIVMAGVPVKMLVVRGLPTQYGNGIKLSTQETVDVGRIRTVSNVLQLNHGIVDAPMRAAIANAIIMCIKGGCSSAKNSPRIAFLIIDKYCDEIDDILCGFSKKPKLKSAPAIAAMVMAAKVDLDKAILFKDRYVSGANLSEGDPALTLRNYMLARQSSGGGDAIRLLILNFTMTALKYSFEGKKLKALRQSDYAREYFIARQQNFVRMVVELLRAT